MNSLTCTLLAFVIMGVHLEASGARSVMDCYSVESEIRDVGAKSRVCRLRLLNANRGMGD